MEQSAERVKVQVRGGLADGRHDPEATEQTVFVSGKREQTTL